MEVHASSATALRYLLLLCWRGPSYPEDIQLSLLKLKSTHQRHLYKCTSSSTKEIRPFYLQRHKLQKSRVKGRKLMVFYINYMKRRNKHMFTPSWDSLKRARVMYHPDLKACIFCIRTEWLCQRQRRGWKTVEMTTHIISYIEITKD